MRRVTPLLLVAALATASFAQTPTLDANATVATVNGEAIKAGDYYRRLEWFQPNAQSSFASLPVGFQLLRQMISERMILQLAKSKGVAPTAPEIDARLAELYAQDPTLKAQLSEAGRSESEIRSELASQEAQFKLVTAGITITDQEVQKHYQENPSEYREPARYKLSVIAVADQAGQNAVDAALKSGKPFAEVAKSLSIDPTTKFGGGAYGEVAETQLSDNVLKPIAATPAGSTTVWIKGDGTETRVKFLVAAVTPAKAIPMTPELRTKIRRRLMLDRGNVKNNVAKDLDAATRTAVVTIAQPQFQKLYAQILDRAKGQAQG